MRALAMLHLYTPHHNAGAELAAHALLRSLADSGHTVDVLLSQNHPEIASQYTVDGVTVHPRRGKADPFSWLLDPARTPDLIVTHLENTARATILGKRYGIPVVHLLHNTFLPTKQALRDMPALAVSNTQWMLDDVSAWWRRDQGERQMPYTIVVHPPVRVAEYATTPGKAVTLINLTAEKGAGTFYALAERFPGRQFLGVIGAYGKQDVRDLPNVEILDHVPGPEMPQKVYGRTKVLLAPSSYESYGRVSIEAASSGIPVIAHPTPGLREALGPAGIFVDRDDIDGWERELRRLFTPRGWSNTSKAVAARAAELDPTQELEVWVKAAEGVAARGRAIRRVR